MRPPPARLPPTPPAPSYRSDGNTFGIMVVAFCVGVVAIASFMFFTHVDVTMHKGIGAYAPIPECGWHATLVCDDVPGVECRWDRRWKCGYGVPWPSVVVRRPLAEDLVKERYP